MEFKLVNLIKKARRDHTRHCGKKNKQHRHHRKNKKPHEMSHKEYLKHSKHVARCNHLETKAEELVNHRRDLFVKQFNGYYYAV